MCFSLPIIFCCYYCFFSLLLLLVLLYYFDMIIILHHFKVLLFSYITVVLLCIEWNWRSFVSKKNNLLLRLPPGCIGLLSAVNCLGEHPVGLYFNAKVGFCSVEICALI